VQTVAESQFAAALRTAEDVAASPQERAEMLMEIASWAARCGLIFSGTSSTPDHAPTDFESRTPVSAPLPEPPSHGLVKDPLEHRVERALEEVRPMLREHGGDVELVAVHPPHTVEVRMTGACHGCPASAQTLTEGVERAIRSHCPEVEHVRQVSHPPREAAPSANSSPPGAPQVVHFVSPFAKPKDEVWELVCGLEQIADGGILARTLGADELLLYRHGERVSCVDNACAHIPWRLDAGWVRNGVITCPHHGFEYLLETGECLNVPAVRLTRHAVKIDAGRVFVRIEK
jgi:Fe-S cluster biogenesis protein NfuA/nitrite reductase/ring-hydroxylating ferredoxin subunit